MTTEKLKKLAEDMKVLVNLGEKPEAIKAEIISRGHSDAEADEVLAFLETGELPKKKNQKDPALTPAKPKSKYPLYDLWKIDVEPLQSDKSGEPKKVRFTTIKKLRANVKLEDHLAAQLNAQSHNSRRRYYPVEGSITNGNEETITIQK